MLGENDYPTLGSARASVARTLANYYDELAGAAGKPAEKFSLRRVFLEAAEQHGLRDGYEREVCGSAALIAGTKHDVHRPVVPWGCLNTRATVAGSGAYLVETEVTGPVDVLRPWSPVMQAGITPLPNLQGNVTPAKLTTAATGTWLSTEGTSPSVGDPVLGQVALTPRTYGAHIQFSHLFLLQAPMAEDYLRTQVLRAAAQAIDTAVLVGAGTEAPMGIMNISGIASESGTSFAWTNACNMMETLAAAGLDDSRVAFIAGPAARKTLQTRAVSSGGPRFVWDNDSVCNRPGYCTADMTTGLMLAGDFSRAILGIWGTGIELAINPFTDFAAGVMAARVLVTVDLCVPQLSAFVKTTTVT